MVLLCNSQRTARKLQSKLLRAIQEKEIRPIGAASPRKIDVRYIAATNRDLKAMVTEGTFREDLFYRLNVVNLQLPALREHPEDIPELMDFFLKQACQDNDKHVTGFSSEAAQVLNAYKWPGNIRELRNCVERMVVLARSSILTINDLPREIVDSVAAQFTQDSGTAPAAPSPAAAEETAAPVTPASSAPLDIRSGERAAIRQALEKCGGNRTHAAELLGISRRTLQRKLKQDAELAAEFPETTARRI